MSCGGGTTPCRTCIEKTPRQSLRQVDTGLINVWTVRGERQVRRHGRKGDRAANGQKMQPKNAHRYQGCRARVHHRCTFAAVGRNTDRSGLCAGVHGDAVPGAYGPTWKEADWNDKTYFDMGLPKTLSGSFGAFPVEVGRGSCGAMVQEAGDFGTGAGVGRGAERGGAKNRGETLESSLRCMGGWHIPPVCFINGQKLPKFSTWRFSFAHYKAWRRSFAEYHAFSRGLESEDKRVLELTACYAVTG